MVCTLIPFDGNIDMQLTGVYWIIIKCLAFLNSVINVVMVQTLWSKRKTETRSTEALEHIKETYDSSLIETRYKVNKS